MKYRKQILNDKLEAINTNSQMVNIEILHGINYSVQAWSEIESSTIRNCFRKAGFKADQFIGDISIALMTKKMTKKLKICGRKLKKQNQVMTSVTLNMLKLIQSCQVLRQSQVEYQSYHISKLKISTETINQIHFRYIKVSHCVAKNASFFII